MNKETIFSFHYTYERICTSFFMFKVTYINSWKCLLLLCVLTFLRNYESETLFYIWTIFVVILWKLLRICLYVFTSFMLILGLMHLCVNIFYNYNPLVTFMIILYLKLNCFQLLESINDWLRCSWVYFYY